jgi:hypothetical protein
MHVVSQWLAGLLNAQSDGDFLHIDLVGFECEFHRIYRMHATAAQFFPHEIRWIAQNPL